MPLRRVVSGNLFFMERSITPLHLHDLDSESKYLVHKAREASQHAYAPYSRFYVGAALLLDDGTLVTGANQENAAYPLCLCAERVALFASAAAHPGKAVIKIAVTAHKKSQKNLLPAAPCGACRQVMLEFEHRQNAPLQVVFQVAADKWLVAESAADLLPYPFIQENLTLE